MRKLTKKATLDISIGAIVVIVIAFVVLGLGLTLTRTIFKGAGEKIPGIFELTELEQKPDAENPLTVPSDISIKRNGEKQFAIGYYNKDMGGHDSVNIAIGDCLPVTAGVNMTGKIPSVASISQNVNPSEAVAYRIVMTENGLPAGTYLCNMVAQAPNPANTTQIDVLASKQIFFHVTT